MEVHRYKSIDVLEFYTKDFLNMKQLVKDLYETDDKEEIYHHLYLFVARIFWKMMDDLDVENKGYDVKDWELSDYIKLFDQIGDINLNKKSYQLYFKQMFGFLINFLIHNNKENDKSN